VKTALLQAPDVKGSDVIVNTEKSVVQLSGFVSTQTEIDRAMALARGVKGVKEVHNKMSLKSGK
jgi:hyperosmotically inducible protein